MIPISHKQSRRGDILLCVFLYVPVAWLALVLAQCFGEGGLPVLIENLTVALNNPTSITWTDKSLVALLFATGIYILCIGLYFTDQARRRDGEEHGSATWGSPKQVNAIFAQKLNKPLTRHVKLGLDAYKHKRNLNVLVIGGSGASKTRGFVKPNILEGNGCSMVITDPKMEVLNATGSFLKSQGYDIRVLNLVNLSQSDGYNPFVYLRDDKDVLKLVTNLIQATTPKGSHESDPFWTKAETALFMAIILMLFHEAPAYEQNFSMVLKVLEYAEVKEEDEDHVSPLDLLFNSLEQEQPDHIAVKQFHHGPLPNHVHFILDEFAAMPLPGYTRELATMRSRNISSSTIIQNIAQIKELYKESWETILGNSDTILYLGGNESSTHKLISEMLGKSSILTRSHGESHGKSGSYSTNTQSSGRELLAPDEVRMLDNRYCILFIRGAPPVMDLKYDLMRHPNIRFSSDGGGPQYVHRRHLYTGAPLFAVRSFNPHNIEKEETSFEKESAGH